MASIPVPEVYRQSIRKEKLEVQQAREQTENQCRQELFISHSLGSTADANRSKQVDIQDEKLCTSKQREIQSKCSSCKAFSIRGYVANVREKDINKCWPFHPSLQQIRMKENGCSLLLPLEVPAYRYWECSECLEYFDSEFNLDNSSKRSNDDQQTDNLIDATPTTADMNLPTKVSENEHADLEVPECKEADKISEEARVKNHIEICLDEDRVQSCDSNKQLTLYKGSNGENLCSINEILACNATVWPTDSEGSADEKQSFCNKCEDQTLYNDTTIQMEVEPDMSSFTEKEDHHIGMAGTTKAVAMCKPDEMIPQEKQEYLTEEEPMENHTSKIRGDSILAFSTIDNVNEEGCITKGDSDGILPDVKKNNTKRQNGKGRPLKKRSISDLIAVSPLEQVRCNELNWSTKLKHMSRRAKIGMWRASKTAPYILRKFKAPNKSCLDSVDVKRKLQCEGVSYQSSASAKSVKEARRVIKRHFHSKKLESPQKEKDLLSDTSRKQTPVEELLQNEQQRKAHIDPEDDLLNDLACFMAKNQYERYPTTRRSSAVQQTEGVQGSVIQDKDAKDYDKSLDAIQLPSSETFKDEVVKGADPSIHSPWKHASVDGQVHLLVEDGKRINQFQVSGNHEFQNVSGQAMEAEVISETVMNTLSCSDHHACNGAETVHRNLEKGFGTQSTGNKDSIDDVVMVEALKNNDSCSFEKKSNDCLESLLRCSNNQQSVIEQQDAASDAANCISSPTTSKGYNNGLDESVPDTSFHKDTLYSHNNGLAQSMPRSPCKGTSLNASQTVVVTTFGPNQTFEAAAAVPSKAVAQPFLASPKFQISQINLNVLTDLEKSKCSNLRAAHIHQTEGCPEGNRACIACSAGDSPLLGVPQPTMGEKSFFTNSMSRSTGRDLLFQSTGGNAEKVKKEVSQNQGTGTAPSISTFPISNSTGQQTPKILNGPPLKDFSMEHRSSNNSTLGCILPYITLNTSSSLAPEPAANVAPLKSPVILSFAQGNKLDTQTTLPQQFYDQGKFELLSYIEKRIQSYCSNQTSEKTEIKKPEKGLQGEDLRPAVCQDPEACTINRNPADLDSENRLQKKKRARHKQISAVLALSAGGHCINNINVKEVQPTSHKVPPIIPSYCQTDAPRSMETTLETSDGQNCRSEMLVEVSHGHNEGQNTVQGENITSAMENPDELVLRRKIKGKQPQMEGQSSEPVPVAVSQTSQREKSFERNITLRSGKSLDPTYLNNIMPVDGPVLKRRKYGRKAEKEATKLKKKLEVESHSVQTELGTIDSQIGLDHIILNSSLQNLPSDAENFASYNHVLKPIAQNTQQRPPLPPISSSAVQHNNEAAEARLKLGALKIKMRDPEKKHKSQPPPVSPYDPRAIENYIKWGIFSVDPPSLQSLPTKVAQPVKVGASLPHQATKNQIDKFLNPLKSGLPMTNGTDIHVHGAIPSSSPFAIPSSATDTNVSTPFHTSNASILRTSSSGNRETLTPSYAGNGNNIPNAVDAAFRPGLLKPLGVSEQQALLPEIQAYLDKSNLNFSAFPYAHKSVSPFKDFPSEPNLSTVYQLSVDSKTEK